jgi:hypothetical protein
MTPEELKARGAFYAALAEVQASIPADATLSDAMAAANRHGFAWWSEQAGVTLGHSAGHEVSAESLELLLGPYDPPLVSLPGMDAPEWVTDRLPIERDADGDGDVRVFARGAHCLCRWSRVRPGIPWSPGHLPAPTTAPPGHE